MERFKVAGMVGADLQARQLETLQLRAQLLANDPAFVDYVAQSLTPNPQTGAVDSLSISELLKERRNGYDVAMVLDPLGKPVSSSGLWEKDRASVAHDMLVTTSIRELKPAQGTWLDNGQLFWVVSSPLLRGNTLEGVLITAMRVNDAFASTIGRIARSDVALVAASGAVSSPLSNSGIDLRMLDLLAKKSAPILASTSAGGQVVPIQDGSHVITGWVVPLHTLDAQIALVALDHAGDGEDRTTHAEIASLLFGVLALGVIAILCVLIQWQRTWLPLQRVADVVDRAASGDSHMTVRTGGSPIVRYLSDGINRLLHSR
ncbi:hypothetical protein ISN74_18355 [Dyella caseinilytica]|uniref:HAMP domain-containing protein n=1 Tax=Dyella caseinilytica TaxID=1849581 RepID=A0ABX7GTR1_9GAMM|nr:hypothetical protein ISN74_18355 [Dyella caseinilytica]